MKHEYAKLLIVAKQIEKEWLNVGNQINLFPDIVLNATTKCNFFPFGDLSRIPELLQISEVAAIQEPSSFSDVHIELFNNGLFQIELLNWWGSEINIHDHDFSGIQFQLKGQSLNVSYCFDNDNDNDNDGVQLSFGQLNVVDATLWLPGGRSRILPGRLAPHKVNHLSFPVVSMVIRTNSALCYGPQRNYFPPFVSCSYSIANTVFRKNLSILRSLSRGSIDDFHRAFRFIIKHQTKTENIFILLKMIDILFLREHRCLIQEYAGKDFETQISVICVAYYRASELITQIEKNNFDQALGTAVLSSSWDRESTQKVVDFLAAKGSTVEIPKIVSEIHSIITKEYSDEFYRALKLVGYSDIV